MILVGPAGWSYPDWEGIVYPRRKPRDFHPLEHLARYFDCVEIDSTFYRPAAPEHARRWAAIAAARPGFALLAKLHRSFTHEPIAEREEDWDAAARVFLAGLQPLASSGRFAALLAQFPVSFVRERDAEQRLERIAATFGALPLALELRHRSWFEAGALAWLRARSLSTIEIDLPAARDHPPARHEPTGPIGYLRLHGRNAATWFARGSGRDARYDYLYSPAELEEITARARRLAGEHDRVHVVTNNHFEGQAVANAIELRALLAGSPLAAPRELVERFPRLSACTLPSGQGRLF